MYLRSNLEHLIKFKLNLKCLLTYFFGNSRETGITVGKKIFFTVKGLSLLCVLEFRGD